MVFLSLSFIDPAKGLRGAGHVAVFEEDVLCLPIHDRFNEGPHFQLKCGGTYPAILVCNSVCARVRQKKQHPVVAFEANFVSSIIFMTILLKISKFV